MPLVFVELVGGGGSGEVALVDQIGQGDALVLIFLATDTTNRRFERTSLSSASGSCCLIRCARVTSSSRVISGY